MTDSQQLALHLTWAATTPAGANQALNIVNGDVFRWSWMWAEIARYFDLDPAPFPAAQSPLEVQMAGDASTWRAMAVKYDLTHPSLDALVSPWHTDADLGRPVEVVTDMSKSRTLGFTHYVETRSAFYRLFDSLKDARVIPGPIKKLVV